MPSGERISREDAFREGRLPILYCSPTMELGVDIAELNVVGLRNVPPTPANYAQRSGRAGRSGSPALVFNYCAWGSSHDQYFYRRPAGDGRAARSAHPGSICANEDLVRSHVHALWLAETNLDLKSSLADILDLDGDPPRLWSSRTLSAMRSTATSRADELATRRTSLIDVARRCDRRDWYTDRWLDDVIDAAPARFDAAADRWRDLYLSAWKNRAAQHAIVGDHSRPKTERRSRQQLRDQAEAQLKLLTGETDESRMQSDFYSYRYFASEGLPARLQLPAPAPVGVDPRPARRSGRDDYLSRPRFLAISEFGPRSIVYHEGSRYRITQVMLPPERAEGNELVSRAPSDATSAATSTSCRTATTALTSVSIAGSSCPRPSTSCSGSATSSRSARIGSRPTRKSDSDRGSRSGRRSASRSTRASDQLERRRSLRAANISRTSPMRLRRQSGGSTSDGDDERSKSSLASCSTPSVATGRRATSTPTTPRTR